MYKFYDNLYRYFSNVRILYIYWNNILQCFIINTLYKTKIMILILER